MKRAILVSGKAPLNQEIKTLLTLANYQVLSTTDNGMEALRLAHRLEPDLIIMGWNLRGLASSELLQDLILQHLCPIIVALSQEEQLSATEAIEADAHYVIIDPFSAADIGVAISSAEHRYATESKYFQKIQHLEEELKTKKILYQAMLTIIQQRGLLESAAYSAIRSQAMATRKSLRSVAQDIIKGFWMPDPN